jgi:predicted RND superfamily exporter protein
MFASMSVGIGVDYAIHLVDRYRLEITTAATPETAIVEAVAKTGLPILTDALAVSLGFGLLILSRVPANAHLGARVSMSIAGCTVGTLVLLPALLSLWHAEAASRPQDATDAAGGGAPASD